MTSKIINMSEKLKDAEDRFLDSMLQSSPIADDGFSARVVTRIRIHLWVRRLALPVALLIGGSIAIKPVMQLATAATKLLTVVQAGMLEVPAEFLDAPMAWFPQIQMVVVGAMLLLAGFLGTRMLQDKSPV